MSGRTRDITLSFRASSTMCGRLLDSSSEGTTVSLGSSWLDLPLRVRIAAAGVTVAGAIFGLSLWSSNAELHAVAGAHPEEVTAVSIELRATTNCPAGRGQISVAGWDITWRSDRPPQGQPAVFVETDSCAKATVGEHATIERARQRDGSLEVRHLVAANEKSALAIAGGLGGAAGLAAALTYGYSDRLRQRRLAYWLREAGPAEEAERPLS